MFRSVLTRLDASRTVHLKSIVGRSVFRNAAAAPVRLLHIPRKPSFKPGDLEPTFSEKQVLRHLVYYDNVCRELNDLLGGHYMEVYGLEQVVKESFKDSRLAVIYNYASEVYTHGFWVTCFTAEKPDRHPSSVVLEQFDIHFDGIENFKERFLWHAESVFGSGHVWLLCKDGQLHIWPVHGVDTPLVYPEENVFPLLLCDMWEHAWCLDHGTKQEYLEKYFECINWAMVDEKLRNALDFSNISY